MSDGPSRPFPLDPPQASNVLVGQEDAEQTLLEAYRSGRIHHAWILDGPLGVGKATLAFRFARFVLNHPDPKSDEVAGTRDLAVDAAAPEARQIRAGAHPNLLVLERPRDEEGKHTSSIIPVDSLRRVGRFLSTTAAGGNWRIVIIDTADDLNRASANALLKMLEEPPARSLFLLVSNLPGRLLPTIRSRCRRLTLKPLEEDRIAAILDAAGIGESAENRAFAARLAEGSLGRAVEFASSDGAETARSLLEALEGLPRTDALKLQRLAERLGRRGAESAYRLSTTLLLDWIAGRGRAAARVGAPPAQLAAWPQVWEKVSRALAETETFNLDRTQTLLMAFRTVSAAAVNGPARF